MNKVMAKINSRLMTVLLLPLFGGIPSISLAQDISVSVNQQSQYSTDKPNLGKSMQQVETKFGKPLEKTAAVGEPPITRWRYNQFTVYFEHEIVIHSVTHRS